MLFDIFKSMRLAIVASFCVSAAHAASVSAIQGEVTVNAGQGSQRVAGAANLKVGDQVTVSTGSSAQLTYPDGCTVPATPGTTTIIEEKSPCAIQASNAAPIQTGQIAPVGAGFSTTGILVGAAAIAGGVALVSRGGKGDHKPASP